MRYAKAIVAAVGALATALTGALADNVLSVDETGTLVAALVAGAATVYAVYATPNRPE